MLDVSGCRRILYPCIALVLGLSACAGDEDDLGTGGQPVACDTDQTCPTGMLCESGQCDKVECADIYAPVCAADGETWPNACEARHARATIVSEGECPDACEGPNPQGCQPGECGAGEVCVEPPGDGTVCLPSHCFCEDGQWICTEDCGGWVCEPETGTDPDTCEEPNPAGCLIGSSSGCASGEVCALPEDGACISSGCVCDDGVWTCTPDCMGGVCVPDDATPSTCDQPNPAGCRDTGCDEGHVCSFETGDCTASSCFCDEEEGTWICTDDCSGGVCVPVQPCEGPNPAGCTQLGCEEDEVCDRTDVDCAPSYCGCDAEAGTWICTRDCGGGGVCVPEEPTECEGPNPAGCTATGCDEGEFCDRSGVRCAPSLCGCDEDTGSWICTMDCGGGGVCRPEVSGVCRQDGDCEVGKVCLSGQCEAIACIALYDPVCGADGRTYGNACEARVAHVPVAHDGPCEDMGEACSTPNPAGCSQEGCEDDEVCDRSDVDCAPSMCSCDPATDSWACTRDCGGGGVCRNAETATCSRNEECPRRTVCVSGRCEGLDCSAIYDPVCGVDGHTYGNACEAGLARVRIAYPGECRDAPASCETPNPAGCSQDGCPSGQTCEQDEGGCAPSLCSCDTETGSWLCTADCGGGGECRAS